MTTPWRSSSISPARKWVICGLMARRDVGTVEMTPEERVALVMDGLISPHGHLTPEGSAYAALSDRELSFRQRQWKLHQDRR